MWQTDRQTDGQNGSHYCMCLSVYLAAFLTPETTDHWIWLRRMNTSTWLRFGCVNTNGRYSKRKTDLGIALLSTFTERNADDVGPTCAQFTTSWGWLCVESNFTRRGTRSVCTAYGMPFNNSAVYCVSVCGEHASDCNGKEVLEPSLS